jgi:hypothetical protein
MTLPEFEALTLPEFEAPLPFEKPPPSRTADGDPWVRWIAPGWCAVGARAPVVKPGRFWDVVTAIVAATGGGMLDRVHTSEEGILACGALGVTARSGYAQELLRLCLVTEPERFVEVMAPLAHETGVYVGASKHAESGTSFFTMDGRRIATPSAIRQLITLDIGWKSPNAKERARLWVRTVSKLLRDERMDAVQAEFSKKILPIRLRPHLAAAIRWPEGGPGDAWQYTKEQQALWALALGFAHLEGQGERIGATLLADACVASELDEWSPMRVIAAVESHVEPLPRRVTVLKMIELMKEAQWIT